MDKEKINKEINLVFLDVIGIIVFLMAYFIPGIKFNLKIGMYIVSYALIGFDIFKKAIKHLFRKDMFDENLLMTIATIGALCIGEYIEGVAVLLLYKIGEYLQDKAVDTSKEKIKNAIDIRAKYANVIKNGKVEKVDPETLKIGDIVVAKNGEKIPTDGVISKGNTRLDTSSLTGESIPKDVAENDEVLSGMINLGEVIEIKVTKAFEDSTASKILDLIENARESKSKTENFITKFSKIYTPTVIVIAILIAMSFPSIFGIGFDDSLNRALIFLVVSCPCALVISVPLGFFVGMGNCSKKGILIKGSNYLDALSSVDTVAFDKTGTLTKGVFKITKINNKSDMSDDEILEYLALCESYSNHYIAKSILASYGKEIDKERINEHSEIAGHGIKAVIDGKEVLAGNKSLMDSQNIKVDVEDTVGTVIYIAIDKKYSGNVVLSDELKDNVLELSNNLKRICGIKNTVLLTGDKENVAKKVAEEIKFNNVYGELLPQDKVEIVEKLKQGTKKKVAFVGDGINDSPVLASADVGISMGNGSDIAIDTSDIVLMTDEPHKLVECIKISKRTKSVVIQNIVFALSIKVIVLLLSAMGISTMWEAIFADVGVSLLAIFNSIRIFKIK
ncbi:cadmium-exporting ATPase [Clostridium sp. CAG:465]|nr:cadmium-exporting ATPase [Clostridium sp. CAG:465]